MWGIRLHLVMTFDDKRFQFRHTPWTLPEVESRTCQTSIIISKAAAVRVIVCNLFKGFLNAFIT